MVIPDICMERKLWESGYSLVAGVDEAGRAPWAGPVTAGAVVINSADQVVELVKDSKLMTAKQREVAFDEICNRSVSYGVGVVAAAEIDAMGINMAVRNAMSAALDDLEKRLNGSLQYVMVDGIRTLPLEGYLSRRIKAGGLYHYSIAAASVLAKVTRDRIMIELAQSYPLYGFERHFGYGTAAHRLVLQKHGPCEIHRKTFKPVKQEVLTLHVNEIR